METEEKIKHVCNELCKFLTEKNRKYGDSALNPIGIFNKTGENSLDARMDDKLARIKNNNVLQKNDTVDLTGYLILKIIEQNWMDFNDIYE
jgi:hypothetical protein